MLYPKSYYSKENRKLRSDRGRYAVSCRKDRQPENREPRPPEPERYFTISVKNELSRKTTTVVFKPGTRKNNFRIEVDGNHWKTCGLVGAEGFILRSLAKAARNES